MWSDGKSRHSPSYYAVCGFMCFFFSFEGVVLFVLAKPHSLQNLSSLTKDQTCLLPWKLGILSIGPQGNQGNPAYGFLGEAVNRQIHLKI